MISSVNVLTKSKKNQRLFLFFFKGKQLIILIVMGKLIYRVWCQIFWMKLIHRTVTTLKGMSKVNVNSKGCEPEEYET